MNVSLDQVCDFLREWGDLSLSDLRERVAKRMGDRTSVYRKHSRGELFALLMADESNWEKRTPVCTR